MVLGWVGFVSGGFVVMFCFFLFGGSFVLCFGLGLLFGGGLGFSSGMGFFVMSWGF